jgi:hypothetical protein
MVAGTDGMATDCVSGSIVNDKYICRLRYKKIAGDAERTSPAGGEENQWNISLDMLSTSLATASYTPG